MRLKPTFLSQTKRAALLLVVVCVATASVLGARAALRASAPQDQGEAIAATADAPRRYVRRGSVWASLHSALSATGDRLEKPGKERTALAGTISLGGSGARPFSLARVYPDELTVVHQAEGRATVIGFDGKRPPEAPWPLTTLELAALETLLYDTPDHFFRAQSDGTAATRFLGPRFGSGQAGDPSYDVYEVTESVMAGTRERTARYYFNSDTRLLERVRYTEQRDGAGVRIEVLFSDWRAVSGQSIPMRVVRTEDGTAVMDVTLTQASVGPSALAAPAGL